MARLTTLNEGPRLFSMETLPWQRPTDDQTPEPPVNAADEVRECPCGAKCASTICQECRIYEQRAAEQVRS